mgnify:CR=1 FL=1|jgi:hypothetical protein
MQIPKEVNGIPLKKNLRGFLRELEKYNRLSGQLRNKKKKLEPLELKKYQLKLKLEDRKYKFTGTCTSQLRQITGSESVKELLEEEE